MIELRYDSPTSYYVFHLPLRIAETFTPVEQLEALKQTPIEGSEAGCFQGITITDQEADTLLIEQALFELGINIKTICPQNLVRKDDYYDQHSYRPYYWHDPLLEGGFEYEID